MEKEASVLQNLFLWFVLYAGVCLLKLANFILPGLSSVVFLSLHQDSLVAQMVKSLPVMQETWVWSLSQEDPLQKEMETQSNVLTLKIPWMEEPGQLQSMGHKELDMTEPLHFPQQSRWSKFSTALIVPVNNGSGKFKPAQKRWQPVSYPRRCDSQALILVKHLNFV